MRHILACLAIAAIPSIASAQAPDINGLWAHNGSGCDRSAPTDLVPILIEDGRISFYESACTISSLEPIGFGTASMMTLTCSGEGESWTRTAMVTRTTENELFVYYEDGSGFAGTLCE